METDDAGYEVASVPNGTFDGETCLEIGHTFPGKADRVRFDVLCAKLV